MTTPERRIWNRLRSKQCHDYKFRRQHGIGPYIVDFFCPEKKVAIEIDGDTHCEEDQEVKDKIRDKYLTSLGVRTIRYTNREIMTNLNGVIEDLEMRILP